jgi:2-polyprenyl-3-methyl-5-hydroxy-6-metoxy-1,4-benzoquinol methylase
MTKKDLQKKIINRKTCICTNNLKDKINFGNLPLINNYSVKKKSTKYPTVISQCKVCNLIQLKYSVPDKMLFPNNYSYLSGNSKEKINNFNSLISKLKKISKASNSKILDIGSNDGSFLNLAKKQGFKVLGVEPTNTAKISKKKGVDTIKKPLDFSLAQKIVRKYSKFNFIVANNFFAQTNNLVEIIRSIKLILNKKGLLIIEVQYLYDLLKQKGFDSFHHEHIAYYTASSITSLLEKYNIYVFNAEKLNVHGGLLRVYASLEQKPLTKNLKKLLNREDDRNIVKKIKELNLFRIKFTKKLKKFIVKLRKKRKIIYAIGAAPRSCVLLNSSNFTQKEIFLVGEVSESLKCNKYVPGTDIMVKDENKIITDKPDYVVILAWHLKNRMIKLLLQKGYKGDFIVPLPKLKIITNNNSYDSL